MIGIGIIGAGLFADVHANALAALPGARLAAISQRSPEALAHFAKAHGGRQYRDWRDLLVDRNVDAVLIATPHDAHTEISIATLQCGKHVLVEKPMARTIEDCDRINRAATDTDRKLMIGHVMHFFQPCLAACQMIAAGNFGRPVVGTSSFVKFWMEANRQPWHFDPSRGAGC